MLGIGIGELGRACRQWGSLHQIGFGALFSHG